MKSLATFLILILIGINISYAQPNQPKIKFNKTKHDFGEVVEGTFPTTYFTFRNTGNSPLLIKKVTSSCGCTSPTWTRDSIMPGDSGFLKVVFNTRGYRNKDFAKSVIVTSNEKQGQSDRVDVLYITGHVIPKSAVIPQYPIKVSENFHNFNSIVQGKKAKWSFTVTNNGDSVIVLQKFQLSQGYDFSFKTKTETLAPGETSIVFVTLNSKNLSAGEFYDTIQIITNIPIKNTKTISKQGIALTGKIISKEKAKELKLKEKKKQP